MKTGRERLDVILVSRGLAASRERAQALIMAGKVLCDDIVVDKAGQKVSLGSVIRLKERDFPYVSRGGLKLAGALQSFSLDPVGCVALDVGASTGGFTHCLLMHGARLVYAVDVGYGQLAWELQQDSRVVVMDRTNIRSLSPADFPETINFCVIDVSFISLEKVLPAVYPLLSAGTPVVALVKPQFEVGRRNVGKGGIVRDEKKQQEALEKIIRSAEGIGFDFHQKMISPITGQKGNREFLVYLRRN
ncbi:MAG TPA: TlyA family RNA methyltransferase [Proteobacteria bacterium]|nr:TlyA family RNA methyltransferase [Pseudomonadota bacterium]